MSGELIKKLLASPGFISLREEEIVFATLKKLDWQTLHSPYFEDINTHKLREIDVLAARTYSKKAKGTFFGKITASIKILVECKSLKGMQVIFSGHNADPTEFQTTELFSWIGYRSQGTDRGFANDILDIVKDPTITSHLIAKIRNKSFPAESYKIKSIIIPPYDAINKCSSFRELNPNDVKEADSSVVWKAQLSLASCIQSLKGNIYANFLEDIAVEKYISDSEGTQENLDNYSLSISSASSRIEIYHPVIVIDADLFLSRDGKLEPCKNCRFYRMNQYGSVDFWVDIVNSDYFQKFSEDLTAHYSRSFKSARAQRDN